MAKFKIKVSEKNFYEVIVDAKTKREAENKISDFEIDYTKGRDASSDPEFDQEEKFWIESIQEIPDVCPKGQIKKNGDCVKGVK